VGEKFGTEQGKTPRDGGKNNAKEGGVPWEKRYAEPEKKFEGNLGGVGENFRGGDDGERAEKRRVSCSSIAGKNPREVL